MACCKLSRKMWTYHQVTNPGKICGTIFSAFCYYWHKYLGKKRLSLWNVCFECNFFLKLLPVIFHLWFQWQYRLLTIPWWSMCYREKSQSSRGGKPQTQIRGLQAESVYRLFILLLWSCFIFIKLKKEEFHVLFKIGSYW